VFIRDLGKFNLIGWFDLRLEAIFTNATAAFKVLLSLKVVKRDPKIIITLHLPMFNLNSRYTLYLWGLKTLDTLLQISFLPFFSLLTFWTLRTKILKGAVNSFRFSNRQTCFSFSES